MITSQDNLHMSITTELGKDKILLRRLRGVEGISKLFEFKLELFIPYAVDSSATDLDFTKLVETDVTVTINLDKKKRFFHGLITDITQSPTFSNTTSGDPLDGDVTYFYATLRPDAWMMTLTENCKIFQKKSAMDIIKEVLGDHSVTLDDQTSSCGTNQRDFCVQYNESDWNFISRLMEEEGIFYYFSHADGSHTLTLLDDVSSFKAIKDSDFQSINMSPYAQSITPGERSLYDIHISQEIVPSKHTYTDYDFEKPKTPLKVESVGKGKKREYYHYPGIYTDKDAGTKLSDMRMEEMEFPKDSLKVKSNVHMLEVGSTFKLTDGLNKSAMRKDIANQEFAIFSITHDAYLGEDLPPPHEQELQNRETTYQNNVILYKKETPYRPARRAYIPKIYGTQTATVSGKSGEEIWTDKYARILVKFHWDLSDSKDDAVSCWVRVAQAWADKNFGAFFIPRVGQEVVITFLNGNPDQPLVTGCVYNAINMPPYGPDMATKSGFKTNSSKGGGGFNELHFEDKKGKENFYMHAQTDMTTMVMDGQRTTTIKGTKDKGHDILEIFSGKRDTTLHKGDDLLTLDKGNRTTKLTKGDDNLTLAAGGHKMKVSDDVMWDVGKNVTMKVGKNFTLDIQGEMMIKVAKGFTLKAMKVDEVIKTKHTLKALAVEQDVKTKYSLKALEIDILAKTKMGVKVAAMFSVKGPMICLTGAMTMIKGPSTHIGPTIIKGPMVVAP